MSEACEITVRLQPRARANEIVGERAGALLARVTAAPADGAANRALCRLIARRAHVAAGRVSVIRGASSRQKLVRVEGIDGAALRAALGLPPS